MRRVLLVTAAAVGIAAAAHAARHAPPRDPALVEQGRALYQQQCASCHGPRGEGAPDWQQRNDQGELPAPPHNAQGHTWKHSDAMLYRIVREGWRDPFNKTKRLTMPAFEQVLSPQETRAVITYLKTLWAPEQRRFQRDESREDPFPRAVSRSGKDSPMQKRSELEEERQ